MSIASPRPSALDRLNVFIGRWLTEAETVATPDAPSKKDRCEGRLSGRIVGVAIDWDEKSPSSDVPDGLTSRSTMMGLGRVELPTSRLSGVRSNHLSYRPLPSADPT